MSEVKEALKITATVLATMWVLNQIQPTRVFVQRALVGV